jgi:hypothetical protein
MNSNGSLYVPTAGFAEADNECSIGFHISGYLLDQLANYEHFKKEWKKEREEFCCYIRYFMLKFDFALYTANLLQLTDDNYSNNSAISGNLLQHS